MNDTFKKIAIGLPVICIFLLLMFSIVYFGGTNIEVTLIIILIPFVFMGLFAIVSGAYAFGDIILDYIKKRKK